ncbi:hypothetical protein RHMOL_Rhmol05G0011300 [Rhododendron molle]|uniref:Uncharacterized protein n=1 Tax=Rhododendron molle TaxID=49168 RepID=A0ACC0NK66_RHOML|nr:hypothetical protein RHMOL_Rhmol05G0011300 [Rhododendron molle]
MALALPRFALFQTMWDYPERYMRYIHEDVGLHGFLQFSGEEIVSSYSKFQIEWAKTTPAGDENGFVHIRCCYNNKYWVAKSSSDPCIIAGADEPNDNQSQCYDTRYLFAITDWELLLILPKNITLKGDNGLYLSARWIEGHQYLQFASSDNGDPTVWNEVFITKNGSVRIKNNHFIKFWRCSRNWIWADSDDTTTGNLDTLFCPVKVGDDVIALRNLGNNSFCKRLSTEGKTSCLNAAVTTISREARLVVEELVISRKIDNVKFRLLDARIYDQNIITMRDTLMDGKQVIYKLDDGVYTGINSLNFSYETKQEKLGHGECGTVRGRGPVEEPIKKRNIPG